MKTAKSRGCDIKLLKDVINMPADGKALDEKYKAHALQGNWIGCRECNIQPGWLLVYRIDNNDFILCLIRTGTHSDFV